MGVYGTLSIDDEIEMYVSSLPDLDSEQAEQPRKGFQNRLYPSSSYQQDVSNKVEDYKMPSLDFLCTKRKHSEVTGIDYILN